MAIQQQEVTTLLSRLNNKDVKFSDVISFIEAHYIHVPTAFKNGEQVNAATENQGSAKIFSFAQLHQLSKQDTLKLFAEHYADVLATPEATNHQNIRQFMHSGWEGVSFERQVITEKQ
jgi:hypothetical protein